MGTIASQITSFTIVYSTVYSDADQRKHQSSTSRAFVRGIHRGPVNSPHKWPVTRKMFPFDDVIMMLMIRWYFACWHYQMLGKIFIFFSTLKSFLMYISQILFENIVKHGAFTIVSYAFICLHMFYCILDEKKSFTKVRHIHVLNFG